MKIAVMLDDGRVVSTYTHVESLNDILHSIFSVWLRRALRKAARIHRGEIPYESEMTPADAQYDGEKSQGS